MKNWLVLFSLSVILGFFYLSQNKSQYEISDIRTPSTSGFQSNGEKNNKREPSSIEKTRTALGPKIQKSNPEKHRDENNDSINGEDAQPEVVSDTKEDLVAETDWEALSESEKKSLRKLASHIDRALNDEPVEARDEDIGEGLHFDSQEEFLEALSDAEDDEDDQD